LALTNASLKEEQTAIVAAADERDERLLESGVLSCWPELWHGYMSMHALNAHEKT
jgi:hypothetical protein